VLVAQPQSDIYLDLDHDETMEACDRFGRQRQGCVSVTRCSPFETCMDGLSFGLCARPYLRRALWLAGLAGVVQRAGDYHRPLQQPIKPSPAQAQQPHAKPDLTPCL
jgi:hypothetical protein